MGGVPSPPPQAALDLRHSDESCSARRVAPLPSVPVDRADLLPVLEGLPRQSRAPGGPPGSALAQSPSPALNHPPEGGGIFKVPSAAGNPADGAVGWEPLWKN